VAKDAGEALRERFEAEMIAFDGTAEELDALLVAHREEMEGLRADLEATHEDAVQTIKETLTFEQGELLLHAIPLLGGRPVGPMRGPMQRGELRGAIGFGRMNEEGAAPERAPFAGRGRLAEWGARRQGFAGRREAMAMRMGAGLETPDANRPDLLGSLIEVLELKMQ
jgi:hypothetical protein